MIFVISQIYSKWYQLVFCILYPLRKCVLLIKVSSSFRLPPPPFSILPLSYSPFLSPSPSSPPPPPPPASSQFLHFKHFTAIIYLTVLIRDETIPQSHELSLHHSCSLMVM